MMRAFSLADAARVLDVPAPELDACFTGVSTDTRAIGPGQLFVALKGDNFDGHRFLAQAAAAGAAGAVVDTVDSTVDLPQILVADTLVALGRLAAANRDESRAGFVAITGSSGKTTVKEMTAAILSRDGETLATRGNLNNHIGVPLTLFGVGPEHRYAVIEMGASGLGEIAYTVAMTRPDVAIITNAGEAHLEGFGSYENIVQAKGEIIDGVPATGLVVLNRDDPAYLQWLQRAGTRHVVSVSTDSGSDADYRAEVLASGPDEQCFRISGPNGWSADIGLALKGAHNVTNALLAVAASRGLGASDRAVKEGLEGLASVKGRLQFLALGPELTVIDDSYNANPASMKAALATLARQPGERIAVLGAMAELGPKSLELHRDVGQVARDLGVDRLLTVGPGCEGYAEGFGAQAQACAGHDEAVERLMKGLSGPVVVLVKGSRSSAMDRVVEGITQKVNN